MWGNKLGWGISAAMLMLTVCLVYMIIQVDELTPPQGLALKADNMAVLELKVSPTSVVPMDDDCDAGDAYRDAIAHFKANTQSYEKFMNSSRPDAADASSLSGVEAILKSTGCKKMNLFERTPEMIVNYDSEKESLEALRSVGRVVFRVGAIRKSEKNYPEAMKYYDAGFALGAKLFNERLTYGELQVGLEMLSTGAAGLQGAAKESNDDGREKAAFEFYSEFSDYIKKRIEPMENIISAIDQTIVDTTVGDVFEIARSSPERMWRVEAVFKLGRYKYNAGRAGDQRGARRMLRKMVETESDPIVKLAAQQAKDLTLEDYRRLH